MYIILILYRTFLWHFLCLVSEISSKDLIHAACLMLGQRWKDFSIYINLPKQQLWCVDNKPQIGESGVCHRNSTELLEGWLSRWYTQLEARKQSDTIFVKTTSDLHQGSNIIFRFLAINNPILPYAQYGAYLCPCRGLHSKKCDVQKQIICRDSEVYAVVDWIAIQPTE